MATAATAPAPVIIEAALNGVTPKERSPHVPRAPAEIAADALECLRAGAAILHSHNDEGLWTADGVHDPAPYAETWSEVLRHRPDALWYPTMAGGGAHTTPQRRYGHLEALARESLLRLGLVDPGSVSFGVAGDDGLPLPLDLPYVNTHRDARIMFEACARLGLGPSISIFEPGFLRVALAFERAGAMPPGAMVKLYFGGDERLGFGLPPTREGLDAYCSMLDGSRLPWSVAVLGGDVVACGLAQRALERGGHLRVGLEDYAGPRAPRNAELVGEAAALAARVGRPIATCKEAAEIIGLAA